MIKRSFYILAIILYSSSCFGQAKTDQAETAKIKKTITGFLKWYRAESNDTTTRPYRLFKGGYPDTTTKVRIDTAGVNRYLDIFKQTGWISGTYINDLREYFVQADKRLSNYPIMKDLIKIPELEDEYVLHPFEPGEILDHIDGIKITHAYIIHRKALVRLYISKYVAMVFTLTKVNNKWLIDYLGGDASDKDSFFAQ